MFDRPVKYSLGAVCLLAIAWLAACTEAPVKPGPLKGVGSGIAFQAQWDPITSTIQIKATPPASTDSVRWVGFVVYLTENPEIEQVTEKYFFQRSSVDSTVLARARGALDSIDGNLYTRVVPGSGLSNRKLAMAFQYIKATGGGNLDSLVAVAMGRVTRGQTLDSLVHLSRVSETREVSVRPKATLGCGAIQIMTRADVSLCLDTLDIIDSLGRPRVRYQLLDTGLVKRAAADSLSHDELTVRLRDSLRVRFPGAWGTPGAPIPPRACRLDKKAWLLDTIRFRAKDLDTTNLLRLLVEYEVEDRIHPGAVVRLLELADLPFKKDPPPIRWTPDSTADDGGNSLYPTNQGAIRVEGGWLPGQRQIGRVLMSRNRIDLSFPPNVSGLQNRFRVRLLVPIQASGPFGQLTWINSGTSYIDNQKVPEARLFPYSYAFPQMVIGPDTTYRDHVEPGGWTAMPWKTFNLSEANASIDLERYVAEFNAQGGAPWYSFRLEEVSTLTAPFIRQTFASPKRLVDYQGRFTFRWEKFPTAPSQWAPRVVDSVYPLTRVLLNSDVKINKSQTVASRQLGGPLERADLRFAEVVSHNGSLEFSFFSMPSWWKYQRRSRPFMIQFQFFGNALENDVRNMNSIVTQQLEWLVSAPPVSYTDFPDTLLKSQVADRLFHLKGLLPGEELLPVENDLMFSFTIGDPGGGKCTPTFSPGAVLYYAKLPGDVNLQPLVDAFLAQDYYRLDSLNYQLLAHWVGRLKVDTVPGAFRFVPQSWQNPLSKGWKPGNDFRISTRDWSDGNYVFWIGTYDHEFVSGPILPGDHLGPAAIADRSANPEAYPVKTDYEYRLHANPKIFRFKRQEN